MQKRDIRHTGFTLFEIMITVIIMVIILTAIYGSHLAAVRTVRQCRDYMAATRESRQLLENITRQLRCVWFTNKIIHPEEHVSATGIIHHIKHQQNPAGFSSRTNTKGVQTMQFTTAAPMPADASQPFGPVCVTYEYDPDMLSLSYKQESLFAAEAKETEAWTLANNLAQCRFHFADGGRWHSHWPPENPISALPQSVKITMSFMDRNDTIVDHEIIVNLYVSGTLTK